MTPSRHPVDIAMQIEKPAKEAIRSLWVDIVKQIARKSPASGKPWYLTLSGAGGFDIQRIVDEGLISLTDVGSISEKDKGKIVAVENRNTAVLELQKKFIGLKIKEVDFNSLIRTENPIRWPEGEDIEVCQAHIINLDLNSTLEAKDQNGQVIFPILEWVRKLCRIHSHAQLLEWTLCLTLHGQVRWPPNVNLWLKTFLEENFQREPIFNENCTRFLGNQVMSEINQTDPNFSNLERNNQQKLLMIIVPKIISNLVHNEGWETKTEYNLFYDGTNGAPMVTCIVKFCLRENATATPDTIYRTALTIPSPNLT